MSGIKYKYLVDMARLVREQAYVPFSNFKVGAALRTVENKIFTGCNIEINIPGLSICAERTAVFKAISEGFYNIREIAVIADTPEPFTPCGSCLEVLLTFNREIKIAMANLKGDLKLMKARNLLTTPINSSKPNHPYGK